MNSVLSNWTKITMGSGDGTETGDPFGLDTRLYVCLLISFRYFLCMLVLSINM